MEKTTTSKFTKEMTVGEIFNSDPRTREIFAYFHLGGCHHCTIDESQTIERVAEDNGVPLEMLLGYLNKLQ